MDSSVRNLLYIVLALVLLALASNFYVASQISRNSEELASMRLLLQKQMMGDAMAKADQLQKRLDSLNASAASIDAKMAKAQDDFVGRMRLELPRIMDSYVKQRTPVVKKAVEQQLQSVQLPKP